MPMNLDYALLVVAMILLILLISVVFVVRTDIKSVQVQRGIL